MFICYTMNHDISIIVYFDEIRDGVRKGLLRNSIIYLENKIIFITSLPLGDENYCTHRPRPTASTTTNCRQRLTQISLLLRRNKHQATSKATSSNAPTCSPTTLRELLKETSITSGMAKIDDHTTMGGRIENSPSPDVSSSIISSPTLTPLSSSSIPVLAGTMEKKRDLLRPLSLPTIKS